MTKVSRRRFIAISAALACAPKGVLAAPVARWRGIAMGAGAQMQIAGMDSEQAAPLFSRIEAEIDRLENIFSLYRPGTALNRLNAEGTLQAPAPELLEIMSLSAALYNTTGGAFDPSIQPLWRVYEEAAHANELPSSDAVDAALARVGFSAISFDTEAIRFTRPGMSLTFNGIAQGYVADRIASLMRREGLGNVLVDMGEISALGQRPGGGAWRAGIVAPDQSATLAEVDLGDRALATSAPMGTRFGGTDAGHILNPRNGSARGRWSLVSVSSDRAAVADGLSTAFCMMDREQIAATLNIFDTSTLEFLGHGL